MAPQPNASAKKTNVPVEKAKQRTRSLSVNEIRCGIGNCPESKFDSPYTAKMSKIIEKHRLKAHDVPTPDKSLLDQSVSTSFLDDTRNEYGAGVEYGSLDHKTSKEFYRNMSKVLQSTQLADGFQTKEEDEEEEKRLKLEKYGPNSPKMPTTQGKIMRQLLMNEAMAAIEKKGKEETDQNVSRSLLENMKSQEADSDNFRSQDSESAPMVTARDTEPVKDTVNQTADNPKFHEDRKKEKEAKESEEKEKKDVEKDKTEDDKKKNDDEAKGKEKREKAKQKRKRKMGQKKAEVTDSDSSMSVDDSQADSSSNTAAPAKKAKKSKCEKQKVEKLKVTTSEDSKVGKAPAPPQASNSILYTYPPPPIPNQRPQTSFRPQSPSFRPPSQPNIPQNFDFSQQSLRAAAASSAPSPGQYGATAAQWQPEANHFLQQEAAKAQAMTRKMKLNKLRAEIASVLGRIMAAFSNPAGTEELATLVMQELTLKQRMYEESPFYVTQWAILYDACNHIYSMT